VGYDCGNSRRFDGLRDEGKRNESREFRRESGAKMVKRKTKKPRQGKNPGPGKPQNAQLNLQTRRVLTQHYRAKYGVK
jgi:hypothetical protein